MTELFEMNNEIAVLRAAIKKQDDELKKIRQLVTDNFLHIERLEEDIKRYENGVKMIYAEAEMLKTIMDTRKARDERT